MVLSLIGNLIGNTFGSDIKYEDDTMSPCFRPGILFDIGISWIKVNYNGKYFLSLHYNFAFNLILNVHWFIFVKNQKVGK